MVYVRIHTGPMPVSSMSIKTEEHEALLADGDDPSTFHGQEDASATATPAAAQTPTATGAGDDDAITNGAVALVEQEAPDSNVEAEQEAAATEEGAGQEAAANWEDVYNDVLSKIYSCRWAQHTGRWTLLSTQGWPHGLVFVVKLFNHVLHLSCRQLIHCYYALGL